MSEFQAFGLPNMADPLLQWEKCEGDAFKFVSQRHCIPVFVADRNAVVASAKDNIEAGEALDMVMRALRAWRKKPSRVEVWPLDYVKWDCEDVLPNTVYVFAYL